MDQNGKDKSLVLSHHWLKWSKRPQTGSLNFIWNEPGAKLAHGSSKCPKVFQNLSVSNTRGTGPCVLWEKTPRHGKNHPTATPMEIKLYGSTIIAHGGATSPFNIKSYTSFFGVLYPQLLTGED